MPDGEETTKVLGWYPVADDPTREIYWNGSRWDGRTRNTNPEVRQEEADEQLVSWGFGMSFLVPLIGLYVGAVLVAQGRRIHTGVGIMLLALIMAGAWTGVAIYAIDKKADSAIEQQETPSTYDDDYGY